MEKPSPPPEPGAAIFTGIVFLVLGAWLLVIDGAAHRIIDAVAFVALTAVLVGFLFLGAATLPKRKSN